MPGNPKLSLLYDGECPVCRYYTQHVRIRESVGNLELLSAREPSVFRDEVTARGWNIDKGMVLRVGEQLYFGKDAVHVLATMGTSSGMFNRLNYYIFKNKPLATLLYPVCRFARFVVLKLKGVAPIGNLK